MKKYAVLNRKGGVGKTTISVHLAHGLAKLGFNTIIFDLDGQGDPGKLLGIQDGDFKYSLYDLFVNEPKKIDECIIPARSNLDYLPCIKIKDINTMITIEGRIESVLKRKLAGLDNLNYDYAIFDCGPTESKINDAALYYVDGVIVPVETKTLSTLALANIYEYISSLGLDPSIISLVVPNMYNRTKESKGNLDIINQFFIDRDIVTEPISEKTVISEASRYGKTLFEMNDDTAEQFFNVLKKLVDFNG